MQQTFDTNIRSSLESATSKSSSITDQIQTFQIQPLSLTHAQISRSVQKWNTYERIKEKFGIWGFSFQIEKILKIVPEKFYKLAIHYVFLKKLPLLIKDFNNTELLQKSIELKQIYKKLSISGKLKGRKFDYLLLTCVKLIGFFIGSHTRQIIINQQLQAEIYSILIYVLLGAEVGEKAFEVVEEKFKKKVALKYNRSSQIYKSTIVVSQSKKSSDHKDKKHIKSVGISKKRIGRTQCRTGTALFHQIQDDQVNQKFIQIKQLLKNHLFVKQFIPKPKPKQTLDQVLTKVKSNQQKLSQLKEVIKMQKTDIKHKRIFYTQMSNSLDLNRDNQSLNVLYNHSVKTRPEKQSKYYQMIKKDDLMVKLKLLDSDKDKDKQNKLPKIDKLRQPQVYSYQAMVSKKKQANYWKKIIGEMKLNNHLQNIEHFPPISTKMYFKNGQFDDDNKKIKQLDTCETPVKNYQQNELDISNVHAEYLTEKVETTITGRTQNSLPFQKSLKEVSDKRQEKSSFSKKRTIKLLKAQQQSKAKNLIQEMKNQVNIIEYSSARNQSEIFKQERGFLKMYSNQPLDDTKRKIKKKSYQYLKEIKKNFQQQCKDRQEKILKTQFSFQNTFVEPSIKSIKA